MQQKVKQFNEEVFKHSPLTPLTRLADITSELGELSKEVLKATNYGEKAFAVNDDFLLEFGDTLYALLTFASECGIDAHGALDKVLNKYNIRFNKTKNISSNSTK